MKRLLYRTVIAATAVFLSCGTAAAEGSIRTFACADFPADLQVRVDILDDAAPMLRVRDALLEALKRRGIAVSIDAKYVLSLEAEAIRRGEQRKGRDLGSISDGTDEDVKVRMNLWSSTQDSVLGGRKDAILSDSLDEMRVSISINSTVDGRCIWRGDAVHETAGRNQWTTAEKMAPVLVDAIGPASGSREFELH